MMKKIIKRFTQTVAAAALVIGMASCEAESYLESVDLDAYYEESDFYDMVEQLVLDQWVTERADSLLDNRQEEGYYFYNITVSNGDEGSIATNEITSDFWIKYMVTARDLEGNICLTRDESQATLEGTFSYYTHYAPLYREVTTTSTEAIDLLLRSDAAIINGESAMQFYEGSKFGIIATSNYAGSTYNGEGGYSGQFTLDSDKPVWFEFEILGITSDIEDDELSRTSTFVLTNNNYSWSTPYIDDDDYGQALATGLYINYGYTPTSLNYLEPYSYGSSRDVADIAELNDSVAALLLDRFGEGVDTGDEITEEESANIWYIARFLDGFIVDTNIEEVRALAFNDTENSTTYTTYQADTDNGDHVDMWLYGIPLLKYGQWAVLVGTSDYGYGTSSREDDGSSTEIQSYTPLLFEIYVEEIEY